MPEADQNSLALANLAMLSAIVNDDAMKARLGELDAKLTEVGQAQAQLNADREAQANTAAQLLTSQRALAEQRAQLEAAVAAHKKAEAGLQSAQATFDAEKLRYADIVRQIEQKHADKEAE